MQTIPFRISGYKCFVDKQFALKNITLLTGSNGTGKSSFIQALLLIRLAIEKNCISSENGYFDLSWKNSPVPLNDEYDLNLGSVYDIFNDSEQAKNFIRFELGTETFKVDFPNSDEQDDTVNVQLHNTKTNGDKSFWRTKEFYYLNTERLGPRLGIDAIHHDFLHCGSKGQNTAKILYKYGLTLKISDQRLNDSVRSPNLQNQVDAWLSHIFPGTLGVIATPQGPNRYQIELRSSAAKKNVLAPNIGFGISYALPIIVNGLVAKPGNMFIVENPEAHLHPKGQSRIGFFLGMVAASGIRVVIETHSEHVVNGIRRAALYSDSLKPESITIYFFEQDGNSDDETTAIELNTSGDLNSFPRDFFDQVNQDLSDIFKLKHRSENG